MAMTANTQTLLLLKKCMASQDLINYIKSCTAQNLSPAEIKQALINNGWHEKDINDGFATLNNNPNSQPQATIISTSYPEFAQKGKFGKSWILVKESFKLLRQDKELVWFPVISSIATLIVALSFLLPLFFLTNVENGAIQSDLLYYLALFTFYLISYFIVAFFNTGIVTCVQIRLGGGDPTFKDGINNALKHSGKILAWSMVAATVGVILNFLSEKLKFIGKIVIAVIGLAWSLITYFIIPVIILEDKNIKDSIKQSGNLFKKTWGENFIGNVSLSFSIGILMLIGFLFIVIGIVLGAMAESLFITIAFVVIAFIYLLILAVISSSLNVIFNTVLYNYATSNKQLAYFSPDILNAAFVPKKK